MAEEFVASNGLKVRIDDSGVLDTNTWTNTLKDTQALREYFQHERDKELGRWRDPVDTHMVVYPLPLEEGNRVIALDEKAAVVKRLDELEASEIRTGAVERYFEAHRPKIELPTEVGAVIESQGTRFVHANPVSHRQWYSTRRDRGWYTTEEIERIAELGWKVIHEGVQND